MSRLYLTTDQIEKLYEISSRFPDSKICLEERGESGIGNSLYAIVSSFDNEDTEIDITDVSNW